MARSSTTFGPGNNANPAGRPAKSAAIRRAEKALRQGAPRAASRLLELCESSDEQVAVTACKAVLAKCLPDVKQTEHTGAVALGVVSLAADDRRVALAALNALALPEGSGESSNH